MDDKYESALALIDRANSDDPNQEVAEGKTWPKEFLYSQRMSDMLSRYKPDADGIMKLAIRAQHIQRWKFPRNAYSMDKKGYHQWRTNLYKFHADTVCKLLKKADYTTAEIERVRLAVSKKALKTNTDTQLVEDVAALVFIEYYMQAFVEKHPEYNEDKWLSIIRITWKKMSKIGQDFALSGAIQLPEPSIPLIQKAIA
jgi:hypothetical protein